MDLSALSDADLLQATRALAPDPVSWVVYCSVCGEPVELDHQVSHIKCEACKADNPKCNYRRLYPRVPQGHIVYPGWRGE